MENTFEGRGCQTGNMASTEILLLLLHVSCATLSARAQCAMTHWLRGTLGITVFGRYLVGSFSRVFRLSYLQVLTGWF